MCVSSSQQPTIAIILSIFILATNLLARLASRLQAGQILFLASVSTAIAIHATIAMISVCILYKPTIPLQKAC